MDSSSLLLAIALFGIIFVILVIKWATKCLIEPWLKVWGSRTLIGYCSSTVRNGSSLSILRCMYESNFAIASLAETIYRNMPYTRWGCIGLLNIECFIRRLLINRRFEEKKTLKIENIVVRQRWILNCTLVLLCEITLVKSNSRTTFSVRGLDNYSSIEIISNFNFIRCLTRSNGRYLRLSSNFVIH